MRILADNLLRTADLSITNEDGSYPIENVYHRWKKLCFRSSGIESVLTATWGADQVIDSVGILYHDLTGLSIELYDAADTLLSTWTVNVDSQSNVSYHDKLTTVRKAVVTMSGVTGFYVGVLSLGRHIEILKKAPRQGLDLTTTAQRILSNDGQVSGRLGSVLRSFKVSLTDIDSDEKDLIESVMYENQSITPVILDIWDESHDIQQPLYVVLGDMTVTKLPDIGGMFDIEFSVQEVN